MDSWQDIQKEIDEAGPKITTPGVSPHDFVRREAYKSLAGLTGRPLIVYVSAFHVPGKSQMAGGMMSIDLADKDGFQEVVRNISGPAVDIFVHSPGGSAEATESIVSILRSRFSNIRFIITGTAKSAATMLVMSGNRILMSDAGELGPTDPQEMVGNTRFSPAGAILDEFHKSQEGGFKESFANRSVASDSATIRPVTARGVSESYQTVRNTCRRLARTIHVRWRKNGTGESKEALTLPCE